MGTAARDGDNEPFDVRAHQSAGVPSVVIAAHDMERWTLLKRAVNSVEAQEVPSELVVSVDHNAELFQRAEAEFANAIVILNEAGRGASTTRNAGARAASGEYLVFLDDDAEATPGWLSTLLVPLRNDPTVVGVGGGVVPDWHGASPGWLPPEFLWTVGASYTGLPEEATSVRNVWSENMAVRARDFQAVGGFKEGFGKVGNSSRPEDTEFCLRLQADHPGKRWWYEPNAVIRHHVPPERSTLSFFLRRCVAEGRGKAALARHVGRSNALETERSYVSRTLTTGVIRGITEARHGDRAGLLRSAAILGGTGLAGVGYVAELVLSRFARREPVEQ